MLAWKTTLNCFITEKSQVPFLSCGLPSAPGWASVAVGADVASFLPAVGGFWICMPTMEKVGACSLTPSLLLICLPTWWVHSPDLELRARNCLSSSHLLMPISPSWQTPIYLSKLFTSLVSLRKVSKARETPRGTSQALLTVYWAPDCASALLGNSGQDG